MSTFLIIILAALALFVIISVYMSSHDLKTLAAGKNENPAEKEEKAAAPLSAEGYTQQQFLTLLGKFRSIILDDEVRATVNELIKVTQEIYKYKNEHTTNNRSIKKFSTYYIPTTLKLLTAYVQLERGNIKTEKPEKLKAEIKKGLQDICAGFTKLLNNMFEPTVIDISAEVDALQSVMAYDGLKTGEGFDIDKELGANRPADTEK